MDAKQAENSNIKVAVRVRPFNTREEKRNSDCVVRMYKNSTMLIHPDTLHLPREKQCINQFTFDYSFWSHDDKDENFVNQKDIFEDMGQWILSNVYKGYNCSLLAYGQTGSGKSFSVMGGTNNKTKGLIPRICEAIFQKIESETNPLITYEVEISYIEIYAEQIRDLINPQKTPPGGLKVREHPKTGPYIEGLTEVAVDKYYIVKQFMLYGNKHRTTASTKMNDKSSRSHAVFTINFKTKYSGGDLGRDSETSSKIQLVDLAGSERVKDSQVTGIHLKEAAQINKSLTTLGRVISSLAQKSTKKDSTFVPFRDSVLTWLLKDSLGGNSKTVMIAAISPASINYEESLNTLQYANSAKKIVNTVSINADINDQVIKCLKLEIKELEYKLQSLKKTSEFTKELMYNITECKIKIEQSDYILSNMEKTWEEKINKSSIMNSKITENYKRHKTTLERKLSVPMIINMNLDLSFEDEPLVNIDKSKIESKEISKTIFANILFNDTGVWIKPLKQNWVHINDLVIDEETELEHGDIITTEEGDRFRFRIPK